MTTSTTEDHELLPPGVIMEEEEEEKKADESSSSSGGSIPVEKKLTMEQVRMEKKLQTGDTRVLTTTTTTNNNNKPATTIRFGVVYIRTYPTILGDNPSPTRGPSLTMDWKPVEQIIMPLEEFEELRVAERRPNLILASGTREDFLLKVAGFSRLEIQEALRDKQIIRQQRQQTVMNLKWAWKEEKLEARRDKIRRVLFCKTEEILDYPQENLRKRKIDEFWDPAARIKPMFENIPCTHCSWKVAGTMSGEPATTISFYCDGKMCRDPSNLITCPLTGTQVKCPFVGLVRNNNNKAAGVTTVDQTVVEENNRKAAVTMVDLTDNTAVMDLSESAAAAPRLQAITTSADTEC